MILKLIGSFLIIISIVGILIQRRRQWKMKLQWNRDIIRIYCQLCATFEAEYLTITNFLQRIQERKGVSASFWNDLLKRLEEYVDATGEEAYANVLESYRKNLYLSEEQWESLNRLGDGMFGETRVDNIKLIQAEVPRLQNTLDSLAREQKEKQKIYMPVGVLGAFMIILLLI